MYDKRALRALLLIEQLAISTHFYRVDSIVQHHGIGLSGRPSLNLSRVLREFATLPDSLPINRNQDPSPRLGSMSKMRIAFLEVFILIPEQMS